MEKVQEEPTDVKEEEIIERTIECTVNTIENIIRNEETNVTISVEHNSNVLGESEPIPIRADLTEPPIVYDINFSISIRVLINDRNSINSIVSFPILITVSNVDNETTSSFLNNEKKKKKLPGKASGDSQSKIIGLCNVDLMPILLGETLFVEKLVLETPKFIFDSTSVSWPNLPILTITLKQPEHEFFPSNMYHNFLNITIESIFNIPSSFADAMEYKGGTVVYGEGENLETTLYEGGKITEDRDVERTKRWNCLFHLENRARLSKYKLACDYGDLKNTVESNITLKDPITNDVKRIEFNVMSRHFLQQGDLRNLRDHITKYKYWPFQFTASEKDLGNAKTKPKNINTTYTTYQCYVDLTELLFPGRTITRVASQLYTYSPISLKEKTGLDKNLFSLDTQVKETKEKDKKGKASTKNTSIVSEAELILSVPLVTEDNEPVFVLVEIVLYYPLIACRLTTDFSNLIHELTTPAPKKLHYPYNGEVADDQYSKCIKTLMCIMTDSYRDYCQEKGKLEKQSASSYSANQDSTFCYMTETDDLNCFIQYLYRTDVYLPLRNALKTKVSLLLDQKFRTFCNTLDSGKTQNFIISAYTYLVERMYMIVNKTTEEDFAECSSMSSDPKTLYFYAEEAYELGRIDQARKNYTTAIEINKTNPKAWTKYAIFLLTIGDVERAEECCREAIMLDDHRKKTLLIYGAILFERRYYKEAEIFFRAITDFYPRFMEGWVILHLFYLRTDYYPGMDVALRIAKKCMKYDDRDKMIYGREPLAWSTVLCPRNNIYMITATFLLKLCLCDLAGIALAQEMSINGRSTYFLYYLAVQHYLLRKYEDALSHLKEAQCKHGLDYSISCLMGHCYYQEGDFDKALEFYEVANMVFDRPDDVHLLHLRMGFSYESKGNYERAKKLFLCACKSSPTCETWLRAGIAFYELNQLVEAEAAFMEANKIDNCDAYTWGYLCLLNMTLRRYDEFLQCYRQTIKNVLKDEELLNKIREAMKHLNYKVDVFEAT